MNLYFHTKWSYQSRLFSATRIPNPTDKKQNKQNKATKVTRKKKVRIKPCAGPENSMKKVICRICPEKLLCKQKYSGQVRKNRIREAITVKSRYQPAWDLSYKSCRIRNQFQRLLLSHFLKFMSSEGHWLLYSVQRQSTCHVGFNTGRYQGLFSFYLLRRSFLNRCLTEKQLMEAQLCCLG